MDYLESGEEYVYHYYYEGEEQENKANQSQIKQVHEILLAMSRLEFLYFKLFRFIFLKLIKSKGKYNIQC